MVQVCELTYRISAGFGNPQFAAYRQSVSNCEGLGDRSEDGVRKNASTHTIAAVGYQPLKVCMVDPGIVLQKIVIDLGGLKPSYLGPPESYRRSPQADRQGISRARPQASGSDPQNDQIRNALINFRATEPRPFCLRLWILCSGPSRARR